MKPVSMEHKIIDILLVGMNVLGLCLTVLFVIAFGYENISLDDAPMKYTLEDKANVLNEEFSSTEDAVHYVAREAAQVIPSPEALRDRNFRSQCSEQLALSFSLALGKQSLVSSYYVRYVPDLAGQDGLWYVRDPDSGTFQPYELCTLSVPDDGTMPWYYGPVRAGQGVWGQPYYNPMLGSYIISYGVPVYKAGRLVAVVGADFRIFPPEICRSAGFALSDGEHVLS